MSVNGVKGSITAEILAALKVPRVLSLGVALAF
jgi:hypothetical protein